MSRLKFDIKYRPQIESGEYKVETRDGKPVRIICWDRAPKFCDGSDLTLCVLIPQDNGEAVYYYNHSGKNRLDSERFDLFIVTPEEELTPFEKKVADIIDLWHEDYVQWSKPGASAHNYPDQIKPDAAELLAIARKQLIEEQYTSDPRKTDLYKLGKEDALKDLPRWEKQEYAPQAVNVYLPTNELVYHGMAISVDELTKLPGFKED